MHSTLLFSHIPKSAGTSFRVAFEQKFGFDNVLRDYSNAPETSAEITSIIYEQSDFFQLSQLLNQNSYSMLAGHFPAHKYARLFPISNIITFVREPVSRLISEYNHLQRHKNLSGSFLDFVSSPRAINTQVRFLQHLPVSSVGFIGITEQYENSLAMLNSQHNLAIPSLVANTSPKNVSFDLCEEAFVKIRQLNEAEFLLYDELLKLHEKRYRLFQQGIPYSYGQFQLNNKQLVGWAFQHNNNEPLSVEVYWHGMIQDELAAKNYNMLMDSFNCPRKGFVGFNIPIPEGVDVSTINCVVKSTKQPLINKIA